MPPLLTTVTAAQHRFALAHRQCMWHLESSPLAVSKHVGCLGTVVLRLMFTSYDRSLKKEAKLKEKKGNAWKQRQGEQKQQQAKKQKR